MELQHRPCDVLSCMSVGLVWGGVATQTMLTAVLYVCGVELQHRPCDVLSCMSVGLVWGGVATQTMLTCCPVCLWGGVATQTM